MIPSYPHIQGNPKTIFDLGVQDITFLKFIIFLQSQGFDNFSGNFAGIVQHFPSI